MERRRIFLAVSITTIGLYYGISSALASAKQKLQQQIEETGAKLDEMKIKSFLLNKFVGLNKTPQTKQIYAHFTCATDTAQIKFVMAAVTDIIIQKNLRETGLM
jgi:hypothetical protein